jgi:hypothetical protein
MVALAEFPNLPDVPLTQPRKSRARAAPAKANGVKDRQPIAEAVLASLDFHGRRIT